MVKAESSRLAALYLPAFCVQATPMPLSKPLYSVPQLFICNINSNGASVFFRSVVWMSTLKMVALSGMVGIGADKV